jgi:hypothetical protein
MPNSAESSPAYSPAMPSRLMMRRAALSVEDCARFDSTWARVERVMRGYVRAMESSPPPAPASACATLSLCCAAVLCGTAAVDSVSFCCAFSWVSDMAVDAACGGGNCREGCTLDMKTKISAFRCSKWNQKKRPAAQMRRHLDDCGSVAGL